MAERFTGAIVGAGGYMLSVSGGVELSRRSCYSCLPWRIPTRGSP